MDDKKSLKDFVYGSVYKDILQGVYPANSLLNEGALAEKYGVSKPPVREALVQICAEGVLKNIPRCGYQVVAVTPQELSELQELRSLLELGAIGFTASRITEEQLALLEENLAASGRIVDDLDVDKHWHNNIEFHLLLCSFCGNQFLYNALDICLKFCTRGAFQYFSGRWKKRNLTDASNHRALLAALRQGDGEGAKQILSVDIGSMKDEILSG